MDQKDDVTRQNSNSSLSPRPLSLRRPSDTLTVPGIQLHPPPPQPPHQAVTAANAAAAAAAATGLKKTVAGRQRSYGLPLVGAGGVGGGGGGGVGVAGGRAPPPPKQRRFVRSRSAYIGNVR